MTIIFVILIILASIILSLIVLIQNPKGGGLAGNIAGFSSQFMGVKQTNDVLERGTWVFAGIIGALCIVSAMFISGSASASNSNKASDATLPASSQQVPANPSQLPANTVPLPGSPK